MHSYLWCGRYYNINSLAALKHTSTGPIETGSFLFAIWVWYLLFCPPVCSGTSCPHKASLLPGTELAGFQHLSAEAVAIKKSCSLLAMPLIAPFKHSRDHFCRDTFPSGAGTSKCVGA